MSTPPDLTLGTIPAARTRPPSRARVPLVWIIPLIAALLGGWITIRAILDRGPSIRYRSVDIGVVRAVTLSADQCSAVIDADMVRGSDSLLSADSRFWVVRPRVASAGISGLGTLLAGSYIGLDIGHAGKPAWSFRGLEIPPVVSGDTPGREFVLHAPTLGSVAVASPAYLRRLPVGEITRYQLDADGRGVTLGVFIEAPYDRFIVPDTRFWNASGIDVAVDGGGVRLQTESLAAILEGGVAFETPLEAALVAPAPPGSEYRLAANREAAMKVPNEQADRYVLYFAESLRGLSVGSAVDFNGVDVGEVTAIRIAYDPAHESFRYPVEITVYPARIRARYAEGAAHPDTERTGTYRFVERLIEHGFRGQLRSSSLLTGPQYVALVFSPREARVISDPTKVPMEVPTIRGGMADLTATVADIAHKVNALPIGKTGTHADEALVGLRDTLGTANRLAARLEQEVTPQLVASLSTAKSALAGADRALPPDRLSLFRPALDAAIGSRFRIIERRSTTQGWCAQHLRPALPEFRLLHGRTGRLSRQLDWSRAESDG